MLHFTCKATLNPPISLCCHGIVCSGDKASTPLDGILYMQVPKLQKVLEIKQLHQGTAHAF